MAVLDTQVFCLVVDQDNSADLAPVNTDEAIDNEVQDLFVLIRRSENIKDFGQVGESLLRDGDVLHCVLQRVTNDVRLKEQVSVLYPSLF